MEMHLSTLLCESCTRRRDALRRGSYWLVGNREALAWAAQWCRTVSPESQPGEGVMEVVDAPSSRGHCLLELAHNSAKLDFSIGPAAQRPIKDWSLALRSLCLLL